MACAGSKPKAITKTYNKENVFPFPFINYGATNVCTRRYSVGSEAILKCSVLKFPYFPQCFPCISDFLVLFRQPVQSSRVLRCALLKNGQTRKPIPFKIQFDGIKTPKQRQMNNIWSKMQTLMDFY